MTHFRRKWSKYCGNIGKKNCGHFIPQKHLTIRLKHILGFYSEPSAFPPSRYMKEEGGSGVVGGGETSAAAAALEQGPPTPTRKADDEETPKPTGKFEEVGGAPISVDPDPEEAGRRRRSWREIACGRPHLGGGTFSFSTWKSAMKNFKMDFMVRAGKYFPLF